MDMEFGLILFIISFSFAILSIILFFKIWGMTNDISKIRQIMEHKHFIELAHYKKSNNQQSSTAIKEENKQV